jgi:hypothetical protein
MEYIILDDLFGVKLWGENMFRRVYHHLSNNNYTEHKIPLIHHQTNLLTDDQLKYLQTTNFDTTDNALNTNKLSILLGNNYSPRDTLYFNNMTEQVQVKLEEIGNSLIPLFNKVLNTELRLADSNFRAIILRYEGENAQFGFHYDTEHKDCFRALILYDGKDPIPPFCYKDIHGDLNKLHFNINEGIIFRGTTTYHGVEPSNNQNTKRYLVGFQYIKLNSIQLEKPSLCNQLRGTTISNILRVFIPYAIYYNGFRCLQHISYSVFPFKLNLFAIYIGKKYSTKLSIGNRIPNTYHSIFLFYIFCFFMTSDFIMAFNIVSYIVTTECFLPIGS